MASAMAPAFMPSKRTPFFFCILRHHDEPNSRHLQCMFESTPESWKRSGKPPDFSMTSAQESDIFDEPSATAGKPPDTLAVRFSMTPAQ